MQNRVLITGTGRAVPARRVQSDKIDAKLGFDVGTLAKRSGVAARFICDQESQIDLAENACRAAMESADITAADIDLMIGASSVPYQTIPTTAPLVMRQLGLQDGQAAAFDINSTCLSFLNAVNTARHMINAGQHKRALIFSSEIASRALPWKDDPEVAALFGDGAAAVILESFQSAGSGVGAFAMRSFPSAFSASELGAGGTRFDFHKEPEAFAKNAVFKMDGGQLFRITARHFGEFVQDLLDTCGWEHNDVDLVVPHQASPTALEHMVRQVGFKPERVMNICADFGNQIAASIPFALDMAWKQNRISPGSKILMLGTSAGVSFGGLAYVA